MSSTLENINSLTSEGGNLKHREIDINKLVKLTFVILIASPQN